MQITITNDHYLVQPLTHGYTDRYQQTDTTDKVKFNRDEKPKMKVWFYTKV